MKPPQRKSPVGRGSMNDATNNPLDTVSWVDHRGSAHALAASPVMAATPIETGIRLHDGFQFKNRQNGHGVCCTNW